MTDSGVRAYPVCTAFGWYVYWETTTAHGARGNMTEEAAADLTRRLESGDEKP